MLTAGVAGAALPGCECGSVPVARRLFGDGSVGAAALTFMLSAPAINPVVLVATAVAFPGRPEMVLARCVASLATAVVMGMLWSRWGRPGCITRRIPRSGDTGESRWTVFTEAARHDFLQAAAYLVIGAAAAAMLRVVVPPWIFEHMAGHLLIVVTMAALAFVLALCSEADAFVAASLTMVPLIPRLVFLVVGPAVDVKLVAMQAGLFGRAFALRFAPVTLVVATALATVLIALALTAIVRDVRGGAAQDHGGHAHRGGIVWLLTVPIVLLIFIVPPALSARAASPVTTSNAVQRPFPPLPSGRAPNVSLPEVLMRIATDSTGGLNGRPITVTGFTMRDSDRVDLAKIVIICCAADARLARLHLSGPAAGTAAALPDNTWVRVEGTVPAGQTYSGTSSIPRLDVSSVVGIDPPANTYGS